MGTLCLCFLKIFGWFKANFFDGEFLCFKNLYFFSKSKILFLVHHILYLKLMVYLLNNKAHYVF